MVANSVASQLLGLKSGGWTTTESNPSTASVRAKLRIPNQDFGATWQRGIVIDPRSDVPAIPRSRSRRMVTLEGYAAHGRALAELPSLISATVRRPSATNPYGLDLEARPKR
jgi:hypothetical protein